MSSRGRTTAVELEAWIDEYGPRLLPVARAFAEGAEEAEDILQEVWLIAAQKSHLRAPETPIRAWLYTVTLNVGRSMMRKRQRRSRLMGRWLGSPETSTTVGAPVDINDELARLHLWRAVAELPELQKKVLMLRLVEDMSTRDAADALDRAEGTVRASVFRAVTRLKGELAGTRLERRHCDRKVG